MHYLRGAELSTQSFDQESAMTTTRKQSLSSWLTPRAILSAGILQITVRIGVRLEEPKLFLYAHGFNALRFSAHPAFRDSWRSTVTQ